MKKINLNILSYKKYLGCLHREEEHNDVYKIKLTIRSKVSEDSLK